MRGALNSCVFRFFKRYFKIIQPTFNDLNTSEIVEQNTYNTERTTIYEVKFKFKHCMLLY